MKFIKESIPYLVIILAVILIRTFIVTPIIVQGESMKETLQGGEVMLLKKYDTDYKRFDVVVISKNVEGDNLIKRVIGLPNETIRYKDGVLYINDEVVDDIHAYGETANFQEVKLGNDEYFVMGDNRAVSLDSRILGVIKHDEIEGTAGLILYPFNKIGNIK